MMSQKALPLGEGNVAHIYDSHAGSANGKGRLGAGCRREPARREVRLLGRCRCRRPQEQCDTVAPLCRHLRKRDTHSP